MFTPISKPLVASAMALASAAAVALVQTPSLAAHPFTLANDGRHVIASVFISAPNVTVWQSDLLGDDVLVPGAENRFTINEGCPEDVKVVYTDGHVAETRAFDTCQYDMKADY